MDLLIDGRSLSLISYSLVLQVYLRFHCPIVVSTCNIPFYNLLVKNVIPARCANRVSVLIC